MKIPTMEDLKSKLLSAINWLAENRDEYLENPKVDFTRTQKVSFQDTMLFPITLEKESLHTEMLDFFKEDNLPTVAAMSYRRDKIKPSAFKELFRQFTKSLETPNRIMGMLLLAVDGSRINTPYNPKDIESFSNSIEGRRGFNQYHLNTIYDVLNNQYIDCIIQGHRSMNEQEAMCEMIDNLSKEEKFLITADRGYGSFNIIAHLVNNNHRFVLRINKTFAEAVLGKKMSNIKSETFDLDAVYQVGRIRSKATKILQNYHYIRTDRSYDYISVGSDKIDKFNVRLVKFQLSDNTEEYLITNLPKEICSVEDLKDIYHKRWNIEISYCYLKYSANLKFVHSLKQNFIFQEIYSKLIMYNYALASVPEVRDNTSGKGRPRKHELKVNVSHHIKICIRFLKGFIKDASKLLGNIKTQVRAGRKYKRHIRTQHAEGTQHR